MSPKAVQCYMGLFSIAFLHFLCVLHHNDISHILLDLLLVKVGDIQITAQIKMQVTYIQITFSHENMVSLIAIDIFSREGCIHVNI